MKTMTNRAHTQTKTTSMPGMLLRLEGLAFLVGAIVVYASQGWNGVLFAVLFLAPDLAMIGYLRNPRVGSITYNAVHTYALAGVLIGLAALLNVTLLAQLGLILTAHIGMDRLLGYGLKYPMAFKDTHLQRV